MMPNNTIAKPILILTQYIINYNMNYYSVSADT
jgi:hypothetical protein